MLLETLARAVVANRESGDLAAAVRELSAHLDELAADREERAAAIEEARRTYADPSNDDIEIDDDPFVAPSDEGTWVSAWVYVPSDE